MGTEKGDGLVVGRTPRTMNVAVFEDEEGDGDNTV
jgi:hypothetical protein